MEVLADDGDQEDGIIVGLQDNVIKVEINHDAVEHEEIKVLCKFHIS